MKKFVSISFILCIAGFNSIIAQHTHADSVRGIYGVERSWWNVTHYDIDVRFDTNDSTVHGSNTISLKALKKGQKLQLDLQTPLNIDSIQLTIGKTKAIDIPLTKVSRDGNAYYIPAQYFKALNAASPIAALKVWYHGKPRKAKNAPWDGGVIWKRDKQGNPFISIACQHLGASVWYPCKDHQADEPDSAALSITCADTLVAVSNGRLRSKIEHNDGTATYKWAVTSPINSYNIVPYIGKYLNFGEVLEGAKGKLDMNYWVLDYNLEKAKKHFTDAPRMMKAFEYWFGPYPFYKDGYKLVEAPHLGMEHQSAVAYGNQYKMGYAGSDLSGSGWGLKWDFIIVHESGHEWFANNITTKDIADMWVHEGFTNYSETLFTEYHYGKKAGTDYVVGERDGIKNNIPIIGPYNVNKQGSGDMYNKAGNMIHTIRQIIENDDLFRQILHGLNQTFGLTTTTSKDVETYISKKAGKDFSKIFDQYLRTVDIPVLEYTINGHQLKYRFVECIKGFNMPVKINFKGERWIKVNEQWQTLSLYPEGDTNFSIDPNFYINAKNVK